MKGAVLSEAHMQHEAQHAFGRKRPGADLSCLRQYSRSGPREGSFFFGGVPAIVCWCFAGRCREKQDFVQEISRGGREIDGKYAKNLIKSLKISKIPENCTKKGPT